ncbi:hypothetical protein J6590_074228 [Homalodisca vitripennis]|nr:hypothetical protein J6590_074228 [Homalodisca vitripennis]
MAGPHWLPAVRKEKFKTESYHLQTIQKRRFYVDDVKQEKHRTEDRPLNDALMLDASVLRVSE